MFSRTLLAASALALLACQMNNPAFEGDDELGGTGQDSESSTETSSSTGMSEGASEVGESTDAATETSAAETGPDCPPDEACGECHACNDLGECVPTPQAECGEFECANHIYGVVGGVCVGFDNQIVPKLCTPEGMCKPEVGQCVGMGEVLCDISCALGCDAFAPIEGACVIDGEAPDCMGAECEDLSTVLHYSCVQGSCVPMPMQCGGGTICDGGMCVPLP